MFTRTIQLLGENGFQALQDARVILFGVGGVGGWCAEALLRTGIGHLTIVDFDKVDTTNLNRQVVATHDNIGLSKVLEMQKRLQSIAPKADIQTIECQYNTTTANTFNLAQYDIVVDAIDMVECKALLLYQATQAGFTLAWELVAKSTHKRYALQSFGKYRDVLWLVLCAQK